VASITIQQIGTTGTATPAQVREEFRLSSVSSANVSLLNRGFLSRKY
jgi:hypothetical protein